MDLRVLSWLFRLENYSSSFARPQAILFHS